MKNQDYHFPITWFLQIQKFQVLSYLEFQRLRQSQWRFYRIFTLVDGEWRYLVFGDYLDTPEWFRHSGVEVAEPGIEKGTVLIHHYSEEYIENQGIWDYRIVDTIVSPTFSCVEDIENQNLEEDLIKSLPDDSEIIGE